MSTTPLAETTPNKSRPRKLIARVATEALAPWVWVCALPLAMAWHATHSLWPALLWGLLIAVTGSLIPMVVIVRGAQQGRWDGHHVTNREGRWLPFIACISSLLVGWVALLLGRAPFELIALTAAMLATLVIGLVITFAAHWKISIHGAVSAGAVVILAAAYGPWLWLLSLAVAWVCWSRVELRDHTTGQVCGGVALGIVAGGGLYALLMLVG